ncbi:MAG: hypothetical protein EXQ48_06035 [Acidobacteria bacterium]|nr:hypothetical protein [Acidobacteriota bacterium]
MASKPSLVEAALGRQQCTLALLLMGLPLACWVWVVAMARDMCGSMTGSAEMWVAIEKLAPFGEQSARISGALLLMAGGWMFFR